VMHSQLR